LFENFGYSAINLGKHSVDLGDVLHTYKFKLEDGTKYVVNLQVFENINTCVVKFYLNKHRNSPNKFNAMANKGKAKEVFKTVLKISLKFFSEHPTLSFGFIGANRLDRSNQRGVESYDNTCRFNVYTYLAMSARFGKNKIDSVSILDKFDVFQDEKSSIMLLVNLDNNDADKLKCEVERIVNEDYQDIFGIDLNVQFNRYH